MACERCRQLLSDGLDLCIRARKMDEMDRREFTLAISDDPTPWVESGRFDEHVAGHNSLPENWYKQISTRSGTVALWAQDQYDKDLAVWEEKSRTHLLNGCKDGS
jgi:hypothetical protein